MKVYIAGKMTGDPNYREKFAKAERELKAQGHIVLNPAWQPEGLTQAEYMRLALAMLDIADAAYFLPDWEDSEGARVERAYCEKIGKPCFKTPQEGTYERAKAAMRAIERIYRGRLIRSQDEGKIAEEVRTIYCEMTGVFPDDVDVEVDVLNGVIKVNDHDPALLP